MSSFTKLTIETAPPFGDPLRDSESFARLPTWMTLVAEYVNAATPKDICGRVGYMHLTRCQPCARRRPIAANLIYWRLRRLFLGIGPGAHLDV